MAVRYTTTSHSSLDFILRLKEIRDTVQKERAKRLHLHQTSSTPLTYTTGQDARIKRDHKKVKKEKKLRNE